MSTELEQVLSFPSTPSAAALVLARHDALRRPLRELGLSKRLFRLVFRALELSSGHEGHPDELWSQFHGFTRETQVAGALATWFGTGIATIGHVAEFTREQWSGVKQFGPKSLAELEHRLDLAGASLGALPLRDVELWMPYEGDTVCVCMHHPRWHDEPVGALTRFRGHAALRDARLFQLVRCERLKCIVKSRTELLQAIARDVRYRMYSVRHAGEPGNVHPAWRRPL